MLMLIAMLASVQAADGTRSTDLDLASRVPLIDLQRCIMREIEPNSRVTALPIEGGVAIDWGSNPNLLGLSKKSILSIEIRDNGDERRVGVRYRHPISEKSAVKMTAKVVEKCTPPAGSSDR